MSGVTEITINEDVPQIEVLISSDNPSPSVEVSTSGDPVPVVEIHVAESSIDTSASHFKGDYNPVTNTPSLSNGVGTRADHYRVSANGSRNFGAGVIQLKIDDRLEFDGAIWYKAVNNNPDLSGKQDVLTADNFGAFNNALTTEDDIQDSDKIGYTDSSDENKQKKTSWLNIKSKLKAYFDTLYLIVASETLSGIVSTTTQIFKGNKSIVGESSTVGNAFEVQNLAHTKWLQILNSGNSIFQSPFIHFKTTSNPTYGIRFTPSTGSNVLQLSGTSVQVIESTGTLNINAALGGTANGIKVMNFTAGINQASGSQETACFRFLPEILNTNNLNSVKDILLFEGTVNNNSNTGQVNAIKINPTVTNTPNFVALHSVSGGVHINTSSVQSSAILQADSTTKGFLPPRMTALQAEAISSPSEGLMIYSTNGSGSTITSKGWWGYDGATWTKLN